MSESDRRSDEVLIAVLAALVLFVVVWGAGWFGWRYVEATREREAAIVAEERARYDAEQRRVAAQRRIESDEQRADSPADTTE